jgi:hypothetical protein
MQLLKPMVGHDCTAFAANRLRNSETLNVVVLGVSLYVLSVPARTIRQTEAELMPPNKPLTTGSLTKLVAGRLSKLDRANASLMVIFCAMTFLSVVVNHGEKLELNLIIKK